jgi:hypothetical protein
MAYCRIKHQNYRVILVIIIILKFIKSDRSCKCTEVELLLKYKTELLTD